MTIKYVIFFSMVAAFLLPAPASAWTSSFSVHDWMPVSPRVFAQLTKENKLENIKKPIRSTPAVIKRPALKEQPGTTPAQGQQTPQDAGAAPSSLAVQDQTVYYQADQVTSAGQGTYTDQPQQGFTPYQEQSPAFANPPVKAYDSAQSQTDMQRRTGGQTRGNIPAGQQQIPVQGMPPQQIPVQGMPQQQIPVQGMPQQQGIPPQQIPVQGMPQQQGMPMVQQGMQAACRLQLSEDRTSIAVIDQSGQEMNHVALGQDRVQKIFKSPDGGWNVVVFKVRHRREYGAIAINMLQCDPQDAREIRSLPDNVEFQGEEMVVRFPGNVEERYSLSNRSAP